MFHAIQLWVNLPQTHKMSAPRYQTLLNADIPSVSLDGGAANLRVIAGTFEGQKGPARTFTPVNLYDLQARDGARVELSLPEGHGTSVFVLQGRASVNGAAPAGEAELVVLRREGSLVTIEANQESRLLIMSGKPIEEPIARYGPFVMNTKAELIQAVEDYQAGRMGHLS
jgi:hypothetical protein